MRVATRPSVLFGVPVLLAIAVGVFLATWSFGAGGGSAEQARITSNIEYIVRDANGVIKVHEFAKNATTAQLLDDAALRITAANRSALNFTKCVAAVSIAEVAVVAAFTPRDSLIAAFRWFAQLHPCHDGFLSRERHFSASRR